MPDSPTRGANSLRVESLCKAFGDRTVLQDLDLTVHRGEAVAIVGPSGSGKSTLLNILGSLERLDSGQVFLGEIAVGELRSRELEGYRSQSVGFIFQEHLLLPHLTALENVLTPSIGRRERFPIKFAKELLDRLGMSSRASDFPATLSGGERQRVAFARALIHEPLLLLADEPTGSLDPSRGEDLVDLLLAEAHERERIVVMVTHNLGLAHKLDRTYRLEHGRLEPEES
ncbi:MAG: ABC transporter ATP-binding protein [Fimbriimonas sp.]|nr:ABC transporter ATP-binding protein [Fimbriimonas sp.]